MPRFPIWYLYVNMSTVGNFCSKLFKFWYFASFYTNFWLNFDFKRVVEQQHQQRQRVHNGNSQQANFSHAHQHIPNAPQQHQQPNYTNQAQQVLNNLSNFYQNPLQPNPQQHQQPAPQLPHYNHSQHKHDEALQRRQLQTQFVNGGVQYDDFLPPLTYCVWCCLR